MRIPRPNKTLPTSFKSNMFINVWEITNKLVADTYELYERLGTKEGD